MTTFSFSHGKEPIAIELLPRKQIRQGAKDLFSQRQGCQEAVLYVTGLRGKAVLSVPSNRLSKISRLRGSFRQRPER